MNTKELQQILIDKRKELGLSRLDVGRLARIHPDTVGKIERNINTASVWKVYKLCEALGLSIILT